MANILGISIGTRNVGLAVIKLRKLTDYRIRTFEGKWTPVKCEAIWDVVEACIQRDRITGIAIKTPPVTHCSENMIELIGGIKELCDWFEIEMHRCTIRDIKLPYGDGKKGGKEVMVATLIGKYPELEKERPSGKSKLPHKAKLFEAVACAELALRAGH